MKQLDFSEKTVMITGASGGIGQVLSYEYLQANANLVLIDSPDRSEQLSELAERLSKPGKGTVLYYCIDSCDCKMIDTVIDRIKEDCPVIDILLNNAGTNSYLDAFEIREADWNKVLDTNLRGTFFITQKIANEFLLKSRGNIVCIASQHGVVGNIERAHYCASKAGIINMVRALALEWSKYNVRANCVSPTFVESEYNKKMLYSPAFKRQALNKIPLKRYAVPEDVANAAMFLSSDLASMITGENILVDGGWTIY